MSYRRKVEAVSESRLYKDFCSNNGILIQRSGIPSFIMDEHEAFVYFLMHGGTWPHASMFFGLSELTEDARQAYLLLLGRYFEMGFVDPGLSGLSQEEMDTLKRKYP